MTARRVVMFTFAVDVPTYLEAFGLTDSDLTESVSRAVRSQIRDILLPVPWVADADTVADAFGITFDALTLHTIEPEETP